MKKRDSKLALILAVSLLVSTLILLIADQFRTVTDVYHGEAVNVDLVISEVCAKNTKIVKDQNGKYSDYIEIYNRGADCNLQGFSVTDGKATSDPFPDLPLASGGYAVIFLGKENVGFALSAFGGETITLKNRDGSVVTRVTTVATRDDYVLSWTGNGYEITDRATPGFPNTVEGYHAFTVGEPDTSPMIVISEVMTSNRATLPDGTGTLCDLVELQNVSDHPISLAGYYLSDREEDRFRCALPAVTVQPNGYCVIHCDKESTDASLPHVGLGLSEGETLLLTSPEGKYVSVSLPALPSDRSLALVEGAYVEKDPSFGFSNDADGILAFRESRIDPNAALVISEVLLSGDGTPYGGYACDAVELTNRSSSPIDTKGWYLTDGKDLFRYALPGKLLAPGECVVVLCDRESGEWHAGFGLTAGDTLLLTGPNYRTGEPVACVSAGAGRSLHRVASGDEVTYRAGDVSIGFADGDGAETKYLDSVLPEGLRISEVISTNTKTLKGPYATCCDWVELYNASSEPIRLSGWYLTDDPKEPRKGALPDETVAPGEYYIVFLSKKTENLLKGYPVMPFGMASAGDRLYLYHGDRVHDFAILPALGQDVSYGRPTGKSGFAILESVTPMADNGPGATPSPKPTSLTKQGVYNNVSSVEVKLSGEGTMYYTTDSSRPTLFSNVYTGPIKLTKTTVVRVMCCAPGKSPSDVLDLSFVINENHTMAVATLVTDPDNLWDYYHGIYEMGPNPGSEFPYPNANFWQQWEKEATVSLFESDGSGFTSPCGIRIFGAYSRALDQKSMSCFFRSGYGAGSLNYPLFGEEGLNSYEAFVFRNTGQDFAKARMRDPMLTDLVSSKTDVDVQKNRPVVLYLNGEYWGIYYIREKINENYIAGNYNVSKDDVDLARANGTTSNDYQELIRYVRSHNLAEKEAYDYVCSQVDIDNYMDYIIAESCMANTDNGNIKFYRIKDGKWRWIMYDVDQSFRTPTSDTVYEHFNPNGTGSMDRFSTALINGLLRNPDFKDKFFRRFAWQMNNIWNPETTNAYIDKYVELLRPEIERDRIRWGKTLAQWESQVEEMRNFANQRQPYLIRYLKSYFGLSTEQMRSYGFPV